MAEVTDPQNAEAILAKLIETLAQNGDLREAEYRRLLILAVSGIYYILMPLPARVKKLETHNILMWIGQHKRLAGWIAVIVLLITMFFHELSPWVMHNLAIIGHDLEIWLLK